MQAQSFTSKDSISVLVVEDQFIAAKAVEGILAKLKCTVKVASEGKTAITLAKEYPYDLIFMDIGLPDIEGDEVTQQIRCYEKSLGRSSVIIGLTAHVDPTKKQAYLDKGMNNVLNKPLNLEIAATLLKEYFPNKDNLIEKCDSVIKVNAIFS